MILWIDCPESTPKRRICQGFSARGPGQWGLPRTFGLRIAAAPSMKPLMNDHKSPPVTLITTTADLAALCTRLANEPFVTVDTEFMREKTYYAQLCLVQIAGAEEAVCIDPLAEGIDLAPLHDLLANSNVLKVFHAARQDLEIFYFQMNGLPTPLFDTQIAAMVCGYGDQVGYEKLVNGICRAQLDKTQRFTDWSRRPLSPKQLTYALADVTHLRDIYLHLADKLETSGRAAWVAEENALLADPATYTVEPEDAYKRIKARTKSPKFMSCLKELAAWRERTAQRRDMPRNRVAKDDVLLELAALTPASLDDLSKSRMARDFARSKFGPEILDAIKTALDTPKDQWPRMDDKRHDQPPPGGVVELLRVLLKARCDEHDVAPKLLASAADIEAIAKDDGAPVPALSGWRFDLFGRDALALKHGEMAIALAAGGKRVKLVPVTG